MDLKALEKARAQARKAVRDADEIVQVIAGAADLPPRKASKRRLQLGNAAVELKKHRAIAIVDELRLTQQALAEPLGIQRAFIAEMNAALTRLDAAGAEVRWKVARDALARLRDVAARAEALSVDVLARKQAKVIAGLDQQMFLAKRSVATTIADEKRFQAASVDGGGEPSSLLSPQPDPETIRRARMAQKVAVEDLKQQLRDVNDRVELLKRNARVAAAQRG